MVNKITVASLGFLDITMSFPNLPKVNRDIKRINKRFKNMSIMRFANAVAKRAKFELRKRVKHDYPSEDPGRLERGIEAISLEKGRMAVVVARARTSKGFEYARTIEEGRPAIDSRKLKGKWMYFLGRGGGLVRTNYVKAAEGYHYMELAREWARKKFGKYMKKRVERIFESKGTVDDYNIEDSVVL
uniref:Tail protein n=1 Tax=viral metagenome TaxID=1070528 RepID=A0A6M3JNG4_9ZZZZ